MNIVFHSYDKMNYSREAVVKAIRLFADELFDEDYSRLHLEIAMVDRESDGTIGETITYDFETPTPEFIDITLANDLSDKDFMTTLAHEMVHVKQLAMGELVIDEDTLDLSWYKKTKTDNPSYWETPWEIEAEALENDLYEKWKTIFTK